MANNYIDTITLPDGTVVDLRDSGARELIADLISKGITFVISKDAATTPYGVTWYSGTTAITGTLLPYTKDSSGKKSPTNHNIYLVPQTTKSGNDSYAEYVIVSIGTDDDPDYIWEKFGDTEIDFDDLGDLAFKDSVSGQVSFTTPTGTGTFTGTSKSYTSNSYTPVGTISGGAFSGSSTTFTGTFTPEGNVSIAEGSVTSSTPSNYTPKGTVSSPTVSVNLKTTSIYQMSDTGSYTAGSAASFKEGTFNAGGFTQGKDTFVAPTLSMSVADDTHNLVISFTQGSFTQGTDSYTKPSKTADTFTANVPTKVTLPTRASVTVVNGLNSASASAPTFTGTAARLDATFTGTEKTISTSGTPKGSNGSLTFTGTAATITTTVKPEGTVTVNTQSSTQTVTSK